LDAKKEARAEGGRQFQREAPATERDLDLAIVVLGLIRITDVVCVYIGLYETERIHIHISQIHTIIHTYTRMYNVYTHTTYAHIHTRRTHLFTRDVRTYSHTTYAHIRA